MLARLVDLCWRGHAAVALAAAWLAGLAMLGMVLLILTEIVMRSGFRTTTGLVEEFVGYGFMTMIFLALAHTFASGGLLRVDLLLARLRGTGRRAMEILIALSGLAVTAFIGQYLWIGMARSYDQGTISMTVAQTPVWMPQAVVVVGLALFGLQLFLYLLRLLAGGRFCERAAVSSDPEAPFLDSVTAALVLAALLFGLLASGAWIFVALILTSALSLHFLLDFPLARIGSIARSVMLKSVGGWELASLPLFVWMGEIINRSDIAPRLFRGLAPWLGRLPGGLLHSNVAGSVLFAAISGSSVATTATVGRVTIRELDARGYDRSLALGSITVAGTIGIMIPPSITMIVYGVVAEVSVARLFAAGLLPGLLLGLLYSGYIAMRCGLAPALAPRSAARASWRDRLHSLRDLAPVLTLILLILGGIYTGTVTPSEAAAVGVLGAVCLAAVYGGLSWRMLYDSAMSSVRITAMIGVLIAAAAFFSSAIGFLHLPQTVAGAIQGLGLEAWELLLLLTLVYLLLGCVLESLSLILMTVPIVFPIVTAAGIDPVWFGVYIVLVVEMGLVTPPIGFNLFVMRSVTGVPIGEVARAAAPFFVLMLVGALLLAVFPGIATFLPNLLY